MHYCLAVAKAKQKKNLNSKMEIRTKKHDEIKVKEKMVKVI